LQLKEEVENMNKSLVILLSVLCLFLIGCDERDVKTPEVKLDYSIDNNLGMLVGYDGMRRVTINKLYIDGEDYLQEYRRIYYYFNQEVLYLDGEIESEEFLLTDAEGVCTNLDIVFRDNIYGEQQITFEIEEYPGSRKTFKFDVKYPPVLSSFTVEPNSISISQNQIATASLLLGQSDLVANQPVLFETEHSTMIQADSETGFNGRASAQILAQKVGSKYVKVRLLNFPTIRSEVILNITE
jgi:hypothetical protein